MECPANMPGNATLTYFKLNTTISFGSFFFLFFWGGGEVYFHDFFKMLRSNHVQIKE